jgi:VWFA-related protein
MRVGVDLVRIDATVTDERGRHVPDLTAGDFELLQDGKRQTISSFSYVVLDPTSTPPRMEAAGAPASTAAGPDAAMGRAGRGPTRPLAPHEIRRTIALVVDDLGLGVESITRVRALLRRFLDTQMQPGDLVAILRTGAGMGALQQFTSDRRALEAALERVRWNMVGRVSGFDAIAAADTLDEFRNEVYSAGTLGAVAYVTRGLSELPGRKSVIVLSDGFRLTDSDRHYGRVMSALRTVVEAANRSGVVIYGIDMHGLAATGPAAADPSPGAASGRQAELGDLQAGLGLLAAETGGLFIRNTNDLTGGLARLLEDEQGYYLLGFVPDPSTFPVAKPKFHRLAVRAKRPGLVVRSRSGFSGVPDDPLKTASPQNRMMAAVTSPFAGGAIRLHLSSLFGHDDKVGPFVTSVMHLDARDLTFVERAGGTRAAEIEVLAMTFGENGQVADQSSRRYTFTMTASAHADALAAGLVYRMQVPLKRAGPYQLRIALRDVASDRIGSASRFIDVPDVKNRQLALSGLVIEGVAPTPATGGSDDGTRDPQATMAVRAFRQGTDASYVCGIYNARLGRDGLPQLETDVRLYREGIEVFRNALRGTLAVPSGTGPLVGGVLHLGANTPPGGYVLELTVSDRLGKKTARATQTVDFDVIP